MSIIILLCSCNTPAPVEGPKAQFCIRPNLQLVLDSFINEVKPLGKVNEIYVDKVSIWTYETIIFSGEGSLSQQGESPFSFDYKGTTFYLYSGLEHYFDNCQVDSLFNDSIRKEGPPLGMYWIVTDYNGSIDIKKDYPVDPYLTLYQHRTYGIKAIPPTFNK